MVLVDVIGIVRTAGDLNEIVSTKLGGKVLLKRDLNIFDDTNTEIRLTVWGDKAKDTSIDWTNSIIAFKGVKVGDYQGRSLSTMASTAFAINPTIPEARFLSQWRVSAGEGGANLVSLSGGTSGPSYSPLRNV